MRTLEEYNRVLELKKQGISFRKIEKITNIPYNTLKEWGRKPPKVNRNNTIKETNRKYTDEEFIEAVKSNYSIAGVLKQLGLRVAGANYKMVKNNIKKFNLDNSHFTGQGHLKGKSHNWSSRIPSEQMFIENSPHQTCVIKRRILKDNLIPYKCLPCENTGQWKNKPLSLHLDHINGNSNDNRLINLRFLCPNCHSQTDTYCGKNKK